MSPSAAGSGALGSLPVFSAVSSISTRDAKGPGHCGTDVFIVEEVHHVGDRWLRYITIVNMETTQRSSRLLSSWSIRISRVSVFRWKELYFLRWRQSWHRLNRNCLYVKKHCLAIHSFLKFKILNQKIQEMVSQHVWTWTPVIKSFYFIQLMHNYIAAFSHTAEPSLTMYFIQL